MGLKIDRVKFEERKQAKKDLVKPGPAPNSVAALRARVTLLEVLAGIIQEQ